MRRTGLFPSGKKSMAIDAERAQALTMFDYGASADLYSARVGLKNRRKMAYRRFSQAADAIRFAIEVLPSASLLGSLLEVEEQRFGANDIRRLYDDCDYPLQRCVAVDGSDVLLPVEVTASDE